MLGYRCCSAPSVASACCLLLLRRGLGLNRLYQRLTFLRQILIGSRGERSGRSFFGASLLDDLREVLEASGGAAQTALN